MDLTSAQIEASVVQFLISISVHFVMVTTSSIRGVNSCCPQIWSDRSHIGHKYIWVLPFECHPEKNEIVFDRLWYPLSILLLATIGVKLIGPHGGFHVVKEKVCQVTGSVDSPIYFSC